MLTTFIKRKAGDRPEFEWREEKKTAYIHSHSHRNVSCALEKHTFRSVERFNYHALTHAQIH